MESSGVNQKIAIIGAGISGLCTARILLACGYTVEVFEKEADIGGVWASSRRYPGLATQNPKETYCFSDWPMPDDYPERPTGSQMRAYLQSYADHFSITPHIRFHSKVEKVNRKAGEGGWNIVVTSPEGNVEKDFNWLIVCNGIFSIPAIPAFEGRRSFETSGGVILHTSQMNDKYYAEGKDVVIIGYGKSSCDIANSIAPISKSTTLLARRLIWKLPKFIGGVVNMKHVFLNRLGEGLFPWLELRGFEKFIHGRGRFIRNAMLATVQAIITRQLGLRKIDLEPDVPLESIARSTVSLVTDGFYEKVADGTIGFERDVQISRLGERTVSLTNGKVVPADLIICGTGWHQKAEFLSADVMQNVTDHDGNFCLYRSMLPIGVSNLLFNGYNSSFFSQLNAEIGAIWIAAYIDGQIRLPSTEKMRENVNIRLAWMEERTAGRHCKGTNIVPFSIHHIDELLRDMQLELPVGLRLRQWIRTVRSADFQPVFQRFLAKRMSHVKA